MQIYAKVFEPIKFRHYLVCKYTKTIFLWCVDEKIESAEDATLYATSWVLHRAQKITLLSDGEKKPGER